MSYMQTNATHEIFVIPVLEHYLLYVPLISYISLVNKAAIGEIRDSLTLNSSKIHPSIEPIIELLHSSVPNVPHPKEGAITLPFFLGLVTTRNCNMGCVYCDFAAPKRTSSIMSISTAKKAIDAYFSLLTSNHLNQAHVHFFGGEPFYAPEIVDFAVNYARIKGNRSGIDVKYEVITNGFIDLERAHWVGDTFSTVVLSLDGQEDIQNRNRPGLKGKKTFDHIYDVAKVFSRSQTNFIVRSCITNDTVDRIPEIADWIFREFNPNAWCVEPLTSDPFPRKAGLRPPDPWKFARNFSIATQILEKFGIRVVNSTAELEQPQISCCPVGRDALIISPDGYIDACYLLEKDWVAAGINMRFGSIETKETDQNALNLDEDALDQIRQLNVYNRPLCQDCFCRYSCAGGCHVNHVTNSPAGNFDDLCIYTRLISISKLLNLLGQNDMAENWWSNREDLEKSAMQLSDRLMDSGIVK